MEILRQEVQRQKTRCHGYEEQVEDLRREVDEKQQVIEDREEEVYTLNEQLTKQVTQG